jgi:methionine synthase II (cobalamin-independent)
MTIVDTVADRHYGDRVQLACAFAELLNQEARAQEADGIDVVQRMRSRLVSASSEGVVRARRFAKAA